jgi:hypothetical protein
MDKDKDKDKDKDEDNGTGEPVTQGRDESGRSQAPQKG